MFRRVLLALAIFAMAFVSLSPSAFASTVQHGSSTKTTQQGGFFCATNGSPQQVQQAQQAQNLLPLNRWGSVAAGQYTYLPGGIFGSIGSAGPQLMSDLTGSVLGIGNSFWGMTSSLSQIAQSFCFSNGAATAINGVSANIWYFLSTGYVLIILGLAGLIMVVLRLRKGGKLKEFVRFALMIVVVAAIGIQSTKPASGGVYPVLSPAWLVSTVFSTSEAIVSAPLAVLMKDTSAPYQNSSLAGSNTVHSGIGCASYEQSLLHGYQNSSGSNTLTRSAAVVPEAISNIWDNSGLAADGIAQFGTNGYSATAECHLYDSEAGVASVNQVRDTMNALSAHHNAGGLHYGSAGGPLVRPNQNALAFPGPNSSAQVLNESMIGWAACVRPGSNVLAIQPGWGGSVPADATPPSATRGSSSTGIRSQGSQPVSGLNNSVCKQWWSSPGVAWASTTALNQGNSESSILSTFKNSPKASNFLVQLDGFGQGGSSLFISAAYLISSFIVLIIFGILDLAVIIAKFGILIMMALFLFFLVVDIIPTSRKGHSVKFAKQFVGFVLLAVGAEAVLGLVALLTSIIDTFGSGIVHGSGMSMLWVSISPIAAILGLHKLFKTFKIPSPFRADSAMAYAGAFGGGAVVGGAMFEKLNNRVTGHGRGLARKHSRKLMPGGKPRAYGPKGAGGERIGSGGGTMPPKNKKKQQQKKQRQQRTASEDTAAATAPVQAATAAGGAATTTANMPPKALLDRHGRPMANNSATTTGSAPPNTASPNAAHPTGTASRGPQESKEPKGGKKERPPMRTPEAMRLEGARKLADQRKVHRQAKKHVKELYGSNPLNRAKQKVADRTNLAWQRARAHPVRTAAKAAMYGAALVAAPVGLPLTAAALGVHYGIGKARQAKHERPHRKEERKASLRMAEREIKRENKKKAQFEEGLLSPEAKAQGGQQTAAPGRNRRMRTWISKRNRPRRTQNP